MSLIWRTRLIAIAGVFVAVWLSFNLADAAYVLPALIGGIALVVVATYATGLSIEVLALGALLFGYVVGNRGFAQLMPIPSVPLLPAELVLLLAGGAIAIRGALSHVFPFRRDALNVAILIWLIAGTARVVFDVRPYGLIAIRDYAMVYYAAFFYLAQFAAAEARARRFLMVVLVVAAAIQPVAAIVNDYFPEFIFSELTIGGVPIIYFKGDLALTFAAVSALLLAFSHEGKWRPVLWTIAAAELLFVMGGQNRASMLGALSALGWLALTRLRRFVALQGAFIVVALVLVAAAALLTENNTASQKFAGVTERVRSLTDIFGTGSYQSSESSMKGDNNRFRSLWWGTVLDETLATNPAFGLGFGYDLARGFIERYNPEIDDFTARSPHSIVMSVLGRMGFAGLAVFAAFLVVLVHATWRAVRRTDTPPHVLALWCSCWVILVSACFGVVLEGPMGAVVFWSLLGIANAEMAALPTPAVEPDPVASALPASSASA